MRREAGVQQNGGENFAIPQLVRHPGTEWLLVATDGSCLWKATRQTHHKESQANCSLQDFSWGHLISCFPQISLFFFFFFFFIYFTSSEPCNAALNSGIHWRCIGLQVCEEGKTDFFIPLRKIIIYLYHNQDKQNYNPVRISPSKLCKPLPPPFGRFQ